MLSIAASASGGSGTFTPCNSGIKAYQVISCYQYVRQTVLNTEVKQIFGR